MKTNLGSTEPLLSRRGFLRGLSGLAMSPFLGSAVPPSSPIIQHPEKKLSQRVFALSHALFCIAYIDPYNKSQRLQVGEIAKFPLAIVGQDNRPLSVAWKNRIRELNPDIKLFAYQNVIEEAPPIGPGNSILRKNHSWSRYPWGTLPTVGEGKQKRRLYDPRSLEWQNAFLQACHKVLESYPYSGLFLDQCSVFVRNHPWPSVRREMHQALQSTITRLRKSLPDTIIIGNSRYDWCGLNGEMNEGRLDDAIKELDHNSCHAKPELQMYMTVYHGEKDAKRVHSEYLKTHRKGVIFGSYRSAQIIDWYDFYDDIPPLKIAY